VSAPGSSFLVRAQRQVFIVDDHPLILDSLGALINRQTDLCVCGRAGDSATALSEIARLQPDIAVVDLVLPGVSGMELIEKIHALSPAPQILVLSMHDEAFYVDRALHAGARGYLTKKEVSGEIIEAIRCVLAGNLYLADNLTQNLAARYRSVPQSGGAATVASLTTREQEIVQLIAQGHSNQRIAEKLSISVNTVKAHSARVTEKFGLGTRNELLREAILRELAGEEDRQT
jgi:DNA-binding NarL/FixJ family response regulator